MRLGFVLSEAITGIWRNISMILSLVLVTFISFLFIGTSALMQIQVRLAENSWYDKVEVVVWLCPNGPSQSPTCALGEAPTQDQIAQIERTIQNDLPHTVSKITYVSPQEFYDNVFLKKYPNGVYQGQTLTAADMQGSLRLKLSDPRKYQEVAQILSGKPGVEQVVDQRQIFDPVLDVLNRATIISVILAAVMVLVAILLTGMTIRMSAASRRNETEIMRLVGASNATIEMPFILEGVVASFIGSVLSVIALAVCTNLFVTQWLERSLSWIPLINMNTVWWTAPWLILGAIALSVVSSIVSLRKYLKV